MELEKFDELIEEGLNLTDIGTVYGFSRANFHYLKVTRPAVFRAVLIHYAMFTKPYTILKGLQLHRDRWINSF